jgi:hypothetical protein
MPSPPRKPNPLPHKFSCNTLAQVPFALLFALAVFPFFAFVLRQGAAFGTPRVATVVKPIVGMQLSTTGASLKSWGNLRRQILATSRDVK